MRLSQLNDLDGARLRLALAEAGITMADDAEEWDMMADSPINDILGSLAGSALSSLKLSDEVWGRVVVLMATAFCMGATYAKLPPEQLH